MTRLLVCVAQPGRMSPFPSWLTLFERKRTRNRSLGPRDGQHFQCSGPFKVYSQGAHPPFHRTQMSGPCRRQPHWHPSTLPSGDRSFVSGSSLCLAASSVSTNPHQGRPRTVSQRQPGRPLPQIRPNGYEISEIQLFGIIGFLIFFLLASVTWWK